MVYLFSIHITMRMQLKRDMALIVEYMRINKVFLNTDKTKLINFRSVVRFNSNFSVHIDGK